MARLVALTLCFLVFVAVVFAACPNGCSGHGNCSGTTCSCNTGYTGQDCSIADVLLQSGKMVNGSLHTFEWKYYHINVPASTTGLRVNVEQTSRYGDIDVYVNPGTYPTTQDYYDKDTSTSKHIEITVENPVNGLWYVGLYGYWQAEFNITATVITSCVTPCVHGTCQANECVCTTPYVNTEDHPDCSTYDMALNNGVSAAGSVQTRETKFYHINVPANQQLTITLTQSSSSADVDLYLKLGGYPTFYDFDYLNATIDSTSILDISGPEAGLYYIGVYGYNGDSYTILASWAQVQGCDNSCSGETHGTCGAGACVCTADYSGKTCDTKKTPLTVSTPVSGFCDSNSWNYYQVSTSTQNNVLFQVKQLGDGDCDLYVRQDSQPTRIDYDFADLSYAEDFNLTLPSPGISNWYLGIYGWQACSYELTYLIDSTCACAPGGHGRCAAGSSVCVCNSGWAGYDCSSQSYTLADGEVVVHQKVQQNQWKYFEITSMSHVLIVTLEETATSGFLSLYVSMTGYPSLENFDFSDVENTNQHEVHIVFDTAITRRYFIGVLGNSFANVPEGTGIDFSITAWYPPF